MKFIQQDTRSLASAQDMKVSNKRAILRMIKEKGPISRTELAYRLKLSKATVSSLVNELLQEKLTLETGVIQSPNVGRNAIELTFNALFGYVLAIDMGRYWMRLAVSDLNGNILETRHRENSSNDTLEELLQAISTEADRLAAKLGIEVAQILSVCVSVPGIINQEGILKNIFAIPMLNDIHFEEHLTIVFPDAHIRIENDVNIAALAENWKGFGEKYKIFVLLGIGSGIGSGLIINGELFRGAFGEAGEICFLTTNVGDNTPIEKDLSSDGIVQAANRLLADGNRRFTDAKSVFQFVSEDIHRHRAFIDWFVERVAYVIQIFNGVINPEAIVLGGGIGRHLSFIVPMLNEKLAEQVHAPKVEIQGLGDEVQLIGASNMAANLVLIRLWT